MILPGNYNVGWAHQLLDAYKGAVDSPASSFTFNFCVALDDVCVFCTEKLSLFCSSHGTGEGLTHLGVYKISSSFGQRPLPDCCWPPSAKHPSLWDYEIPELIPVDSNPLCMIGAILMVNTLGWNQSFSILQFFYSFVPILASPTPCLTETGFTLC